MKNMGWTGVVLAGGKSSRMGRDKALIEIDGRSMLDMALDKLQDHVADLLVIGDPAKYGHVGPFVIADEVSGKGPLGGLVTAMRFSTNDKLLVLACDMPGITGKLLEQLKAGLGNFTDAVMPVHDGRAEPLCAAYHRRCEQTFRNAINDGELKLQEVVQRICNNKIEIDPGKNGWPIDLFRNLNAPHDL